MTRVCRYYVQLVGAFFGNDVKLMACDVLPQDSPGRMGEDIVQGGAVSFPLIALLAIAVTAGTVTMVFAPANASAAQVATEAPDLVSASARSASARNEAALPIAQYHPPLRAQRYRLAQANWLDRARDVLQGATGDGRANPGSASLSELTESDIGKGLKEALRVGTERVVAQLAAVDGFNKDPQIHIPLPPALQTVQSTLNRFGLGGLADDLEVRLNRAAEAAAPEAKALFWQAIEQMTLDDVRAIFNGPDNAATTYFQGKMSAPLAERMTPIVDASLAEVGAVQVYDQLIAGYRDIPFVPNLKADLTTHVVDRALAGMFHYVGQEEAAIRQKPVERTTDLLKKVFGAN